MSSTTPLLVLVLLLSFEYCASYGYRYRFDPVTQQTELWVHLPGTDSPSVYRNNVLQRGAVELSPGYFSDPGVYRYTGVDGRLRWRCKEGAYYSSAYGKCFWNSGRGQYYYS